jgi:acetate kinase
VLPILHLNGYKIANPTVLGRFSDEGIARLLEGHGYAPRFVAGDDPVRVHHDLAAALDHCFDAIAEVSSLAPLHNPPALALIRELPALAPDPPAIACFDTSFHATMPAGATTYAIPAAWRERLGIRRYGFHGLSHAHAVRRTAELLARPVDQLRIVSCHLGAGASLAAVDRGRSVDTSMGFTPLEGLVMATRLGDLDSGALLWLQQQTGQGAAELEEVLNDHCGLLALAGTADLRVILERARSGDAQASLAREVYLHRLVKGIAAMRAALPRLHALVFSGRVGEHAGEIRAAACARLGFLGIPDRLHDHGGGDAVVSSPGSAVAVAVVTAREDLEMTRQARALLASGRSPSAR